MTKNEQNKTSKTDRLLKTKDVLEILQTSSVTLWRLVKKGKIPAPIKLNEGGINLYKESWIIKFIENIESDTIQIPEATAEEVERHKKLIAKKPQVRCRSVKKAGI